MDGEFAIELSPKLLALVPVIAAIIQILKRLPQLQALKAWLPVVSVVLGIGFAYLNKVPDPIVPGITLGLLASGAYDVLKGAAASKTGHAGGPVSAPPG
jgi:hypothetical protein